LLGRESIQKTAKVGESGPETIRPETINLIVKTQASWGQRDDHQTTRGLVFAPNTATRAAFPISLGSAEQPEQHQPQLTDNAFA